MMGAQSERLLMQALTALPRFIGGTLRLNAGYSGPILQVSNGTTTRDVASVNDIPAFCGSSDGVVATVYDQSGNGRDYQAPATKRPKIYDGATTALIRKNPRGPIVMRFDGVDDYLSRADGCGLTGSPSITAWLLATNNFPFSGGYAHWGTTGTTGGDFTLQFVHDYNGLGIDAPRITSASNFDVIFSPDPLPGGETSAQYHDDVVSFVGGTSGAGRETWRLNNTVFPAIENTVATPNLNNLGSGIGARTAGNAPLHGDISCVGMWSPQLSAADIATLARFGQVWRLQ